MSKKLNISVDNEGHDQVLVLKAYSPGDGALALNCSFPSDPTGPVAPFKASEKDIVKMRDTHFRDFGILKSGTKHPQYRFYKPVERISENELKHEGRIYRFEKHPMSEGADPDSQRISVFADAPKTLGGTEFEVENISIKGALDYYLKHEDAINKSKKEFNNEKAHDYSVNGGAKEDRNAGYNM